MMQFSEQPGQFGPEAPAEVRRGIGGVSAQRNEIKNILSPSKVKGALHVLGRYPEGTTPELKIAYFQQAEGEMQPLLLEGVLPIIATYSQQAIERLIISGIHHRGVALQVIGVLCERTDLDEKSLQNIANAMHHQHWGECMEPIMRRWENQYALQSTEQVLAEFADRERKGNLPNGRSEAILRALYAKGVPLERILAKPGFRPETFARAFGKYGDQIEKLLPKKPISPSPQQHLASPGA